MYKCPVDHQLLRQYFILIMSVNDGHQLAQQ